MVAFIKQPKKAVGSDVAYSFIPEKIHEKNIQKFITSRLPTGSNGLHQLPADRLTANDKSTSKENVYSTVQSNILIIYIIYIYNPIYCIIIYTI